MNLSPIEKWQADFAKDPLLAIDNLLLGRVYMGKLHRNEASEIFFRLFHMESIVVQHALDMAMQDWFAKYWMAFPPSVSSPRWTEILKNAFLTVYRLNLGETCQWLLRSHSRGRTWLRSLYLSPARDPESALLRTLALRQKDQDLLPLWMRLCRMEEDLPLHYASIGLLGLRKLSEKNGEPAGDLHEAVFEGIISLARAINTQVRPHERREAEQFWLLECRTIMGLYPRSTQYWTNHFLPLIRHRTGSIEAELLGKVIPGLAKRMKRQAHGKRQIRNYVQPSYSEYSDMLKLLTENPTEKINSELNVFLDRYHHYARQTGDSEFLVKTFCEIGNLIFRQNVGLALDLVEEAFLWEPYNPYVWTARSTIEAYRGNYSQAAALLWEAKRKFPENATIRNILANLLKKQREHNIAEIIYRQAIIDFPDNEVCRTGLAEVLKAQGKLKDSESVYRQAIIDFPDNVVCRTGLAGVLLQLRRTEESIALLEETVKKFPDNLTAKGFLGKVKGGEEVSDVLIYVDEQSEEMPEFPLKVRVGSDVEFHENYVDDIETEIGMVNLYRLAGRCAEGEEREKYRENAFSALKKVLSKDPDNIPTLLEKGWWLTEHDLEEAEDFFFKQIECHPNVLGFRLGNVRSESLKGVKRDARQWNDLSDSFPGRSTLIRLEYAIQELSNGNGTRLNALESLRKQLGRDVKRLPVSIQENEKWAISKVKQSLFKTISIDRPLTENDFPQISSNHEEHKNMLKGTVEQCLGTI